jgi:predicted kinase
MSAQTQMTLEFLQRRIKAIQTDIQDLTVMYLQAQSTKNMPLAEQCDIALNSALQQQVTITQAFMAYERPIRKTF